ncbi:hypothetical protein ABLE68_07825 [Nocardioides sp. CN2-186]|uniref:hypothetical protein n=1 Tax=Nocardioides tweenelious TaxID=3156607 RepID=UPI0032B3A0AF
MTPGPEDTPGVRRAWGWVAHLLSGGTTPWRVWTDEGRPGGRVLPGAQQLELLRRLNLVGGVTPELATRVLEASAPGRGRPDLELEGSVDRLAFGPPPVDPGDLPDDELLRVATSLIADDVVAAGLPEPRRVGTTRPWRTRYRLVGDPLLADPRRADLIARGRPPGGRGSVILVLGTDLGSMLVHAWTARSLAEGAPAWRDWFDSLARSRTVPARADLPRVARFWTDRVGIDRVRIVLEPALVPRLVGVRRPLATAPDLSADAVDLSRRVGQVLGLLAEPARRRALLHQTLAPHLATHHGPGLGVPPEHAAWVHARAERMRDGLLRAGYAVHGDPDSLLPVDHVGASEPSDAGVLALALRLLLEKPLEKGK